MAMEGPVRKAWAPRRSASRGLAWIAAAFAWTAAGVVAIALAAVFAATLVVGAVVASSVFVVAAILMRVGRGGRAQTPEPGLIEAHHMGGHSWVAYGWDHRPQA